MNIAERFKRAVEAQAAAPYDNQYADYVAAVEALLIEIADLPMNSATAPLKALAALYALDEQGIDEATAADPCERLAVQIAEHIGCNQVPA